MISNELQDRINMAKEIAEVRETGLTNMLDYYRVIELLEERGHENTAYYLSENKSDYMNLLILSGNY